MARVRISTRTAVGRPNELARARARLIADGAPITELADSNPTRHGLTPPGVLAAVRRHIYDAARYDPHPRGLLAARVALAERYGGEPGDYWLTSSTSEAYSWLCMMLTDPGEVVAIPRPGYPLIPPIARLTGARAVDYRIDYVHPQGWLIDPDSLGRAARDPSVRAVVAVSPGNPTGAYLAADTELVVEACARGGSVLVADEVFEPFPLDGTAVSVAGERRVVTFALGGLSKLLCAPQLKLGWIRLSGPADELAEAREGLDAIADMFLPVAGPIAAALPELLGLADEAVAAVRDRLLTNLAAVRAILADGPYRVRRTDGGWSVLVDVPGYLESEQLAVYLLREAGLAVHPGWFYDIPGEGVLALSLLPRSEEFAAGVRRLREAIDALAE